MNFYKVVYYACSVYLFVLGGPVVNLEVREVKKIIDAGGEFWG
ncbi:hypothetical protein [Ancylothrix sp. D3o]|nr:hypothetical protein [Ancylothrix sp. D3o]